MDKPRKFIDLVIPFNNEYLNLQILLPKIIKIIKPKHANIFIPPALQASGTGATDTKTTAKPPSAV